LLQASGSIAVGEEAILNLWQAWEGGSFVPAKVEYPTTFDIQSLASLLENGVALQSLRLGANFDKYFKKKVVHSFVDQREGDVLKLIEEEIDSGATDLKELPPIVNFEKTNQKTAEIMKEIMEAAKEEKTIMAEA
jgi:hypothetical protein